MLPPESESPPFFGSWKRNYLGVLVFFILSISTLGAFTEAFRLLESQTWLFFPQTLAS